MLINLAEIWQVDEVTAAADWWSVGALLYEIITGQVNFSLLFASHSSTRKKKGWQLNFPLLTSEDFRSSKRHDDCH